MYYYAFKEYVKYFYCVKNRFQYTGRLVVDSEHCRSHIKVERKNYIKRNDFISFIVKDTYVTDM